METLKINIKGIFESIGYLLLIGLCAILSLAAAFGINILITGNFDFAIKYLDMPCIALGGLAAFAAFKKSGKVFIPKAVKVSAKFLIAVFFIGFAISGISDALTFARLYDPTYIYHTDMTKQIIAMLGAPIAEELISRVLITSAVRKNRKSFSLVALLVSSIIFTVMHLSFKPSALIHHMIFALFVGYVYQTTGSYKACVLCHMGSNIANTLAMLSYNHINMTLIYIGLIVMILLVIGAFVLFVKEFGKTDKHCKLADLWYNANGRSKKGVLVANEDCVM